MGLCEIHRYLYYSPDYVKESSFPMQHIELFYYENLTLKTVGKMAVFAVLTFVLKSYGKTERSHPEVHLFFYMQR